MITLHSNEENRTSKNYKELRRMLFGREAFDLILSIIFWPLWSGQDMWLSNSVWCVGEYYKLSASQNFKESQLCEAST